MLIGKKILNIAKMLALVGVPLPKIVRAFFIIKVVIGFPQFHINLTGV